jgi:hypothetical protein
MSLCDKCEHARRVPAESLREEGFGGCSILAKWEWSPEYAVIGIECSDAATGWVDLNARPEGPSSGKMANLQLLVKNVTLCKHFESRTNLCR